MPTIIISPVNVMNFLEGGGHFWVYLQYVQGLRQLGCDVYWLEHYRSRGHEALDASIIEAFVKRMEGYGFSGKLIVYVSREGTAANSGPYETIGMTQQEAEAVFRRADLLLNFH